MRSFLDLRLSFQDKPENWSEMTWQEKREVRFQRWLNPPDVKFVSPEAEKLYKERVTRFMKAIKLEEPDRVPVMLPTGNSPAYWAGANFRTLMYDYDKARQIWIKYMEAFGDMDTFNGPMLVPSGKIAEVVTSKLQKLPGLGLPEDASMNQFVEGEYMMPDEYDLLMLDPSDYNVRVMMPRTSDFFKSFAKLPPLRMSMGNPWVAALADPDIRQTFQSLMDLSDEYIKWMTANMEINNYIRSRGYPSLFGGLMAGAPFDQFGDALRGTHGIIMDMYRQPEKLHEAMEYWLNLMVQTSVKNFPITASPVCIMPLHKGDDTFMSDRQFEEFYWPTLRRLFLAMIDEGLVPMPFAEGKYNKRLKQITDTPKSGVIWWFDQTDMAVAKRVLGDICCIVGNVPTSIVKTGTVAQVKENCRRLIEDCAPGGGYILGGGASIDKGKIENLQAMQAAAREYGVY
jgi:uroporphyrinogen-III decarboxylase